MKKKIFIKKDINVGGEVLNNFEKETLTSLIGKIKEGNLIVLLIKKTYILIQKITDHYEMDILSNDEKKKWENIKYDDYSLRVTLHAIYQSPDIRNVKFYEYKYDTKNITEKYMKIIDALLKEIDADKKRTR